MFSVKLCAVLNYTQVFRQNAALQHHYICSPPPTSKALSTPICSQNDRFQLILHLRLNITVAAVYPFTLKRSKDSLIPFSVMRMTSNVLIGSVFTLMRRGSTMSTVSIQDCVFKYMRLRYKWWVFQDRFQDSDEKTNQKAWVVKNVIMFI